MMTPGHNQIPNETCYQQFATVVRDFLEQNKNNGKIKHYISIVFLFFCFVR